MSDKPEPRFDIDYAYGRQAELQIEELLGWVATKSKFVEVKRKRILDLNFYVETHCDKGRRGVYERSGILTTESRVWFFVIGDTGLSVCIPTDLLEIMVADSSSQDKEETHGSCPTRGKLVNLGALLFRAKQRQAVVKSLPEPVETQAVVVTAEPVQRELLVDEIHW